MLALTLATDPRPAPPPAWEKLASGLPAEIAWSDVSETSDLAVFSWQERDSLHARYYNANIARFLSVDPAGTRPRSPQSWSAFSYSRANPLNRVDPDGLTDISILIQRGPETSKSTPGSYSTSGVTASGRTLELPGRENLPFKSRIPAGTYKATRHNSPSLGSVLKLHEVPGRSDILLHPGNTPDDTKGCILPGTTASTDKVLHSKLALTGLLVGIDFIAKIDKANGESTSIWVTIQDPPDEPNCVGEGCQTEPPAVRLKEPTPKDVPQSR
jgi:RHS repeat-associated protein